MLCRCSPLIFNAFPSVLVCYPDFVFCPWIYEFWTAGYYCCLYWWPWGCTWYFHPCPLEDSYLIAQSYNSSLFSYSLLYNILPRVVFRCTVSSHNNLYTKNVKKNLSFYGNIKDEYGITWVLLNCTLQNIIFFFSWKYITQRVTNFFH